MHPAPRGAFLPAAVPGMQQSRPSQCPSSWMAQGIWAINLKPPDATEIVEPAIR
jgi:hypothetical protein